MPALYTANLLLGFALLFWPVWFSRVCLGLRGADPFLIVMLIGLPIQLMRLFGGPLFLIEGGLFDPAYQYALLMGNIHTFAQTIGLVVALHAFRRMRADRWLPGRRTPLGTRTLKRGAILFMGFFALSFYMLASSELGLWNWLQNPRIGYQFYRQGQGHWYALAITALSTSFTLRFLAAPRVRPLLLWAGFYLVLSLVFGSKGVMLAFFTSLLIYLWLIGSKYLTTVFAVGAPLAFLLMVGNLYLALGDTFELAEVFGYFDYYKNAADYYRGVLSGEIQLYYGEVLLSSFWSYVPRALWPEKPFVYGVLIVNEIFFPGQAELTHTPDFGGAVEQYADFGVFGVVLFGLLSAESIVLALMSYLIFVRPGVNLNHVTSATVALLLIQFAPMFGHYFPGVLFALVLVVVMTIVGAMRSRRRRRHQHSVLSVPGQTI